ncbi:MAG: chemotaxis protein CheW, partial [Oceanospirillaceae bacterium]|nr:chemotaxis protein CheW [Oceanospirillaceae bacterium]
MKDTKSKEKALIGPQIAVQRYLDDLLQEATSEPLAEDVDESNLEEQELSSDVELDVVESESADLDSQYSEEELSSLDASFKGFEEAISAHVDGLSSNSEEHNIVQPEPEPE